MKAVKSGHEESIRLMLRTQNPIICQLSLQEKVSVTCIISMTVISLVSKPHLVFQYMISECNIDKPDIGPGDEANSNCIDIIIVKVYNYPDDTVVTKTSAY